MIRLACKIPNKVVLACSAGRDSMSALEFLLRGRREVTVAYFNHSTPHGDDAERFLRSFCSQECLPLVVGQYHHKPSLSKPSEASWREARYEFLSSLNQPIVTANCILTLRILQTHRQYTLEITLDMRWYPKP